MELPRAVATTKTQPLFHFVHRPTPGPHAEWRRPGEPESRVLHPHQPVQVTPTHRQASQDILQSYQSYPATRNVDDTCRRPGAEHDRVTKGPHLFAERETGGEKTIQIALRQCARARPES